MIIIASGQRRESLGWR